MSGEKLEFIVARLDTSPERGLWSHVAACLGRSLRRLRWALAAPVPLRPSRAVGLCPSLDLGNPHHTVPPVPRCSRYGASPLWSPSATGVPAPGADHRPRGVAGPHGRQDTRRRCPYG
jgi:hypothetical protein